MTTEELIEKLEMIQTLKCETSTLELKSAEKITNYLFPQKYPEWILWIDQLGKVQPDTRSVTYAIQTHVMPLVEQGVIKMSIPDKPKSPKQFYYSE